VEKGRDINTVNMELTLTTAGGKIVCRRCNASDLLPSCRTKVMEQNPLISENSGYETIQIYR
jgi:hypothetical protein